MKDSIYFGFEGHCETGDNDHVEMPLANWLIQTGLLESNDWTSSL